MASDTEKPDYLVLFWVGNSAKNEVRQAASTSPLVCATWAMSGNRVAAARSIPNFGVLSPRLTLNRTLIILFIGLLPLMTVTLRPTRKRRSTT